MYSLLEQEKEKEQIQVKTLPVFYDKLCDDTLGYVIGFLGDEEKAEWCHVNERMCALVVEHDPTFTFLSCRRCGRHVKRCSCPRRRGWGNTVVSIVVVGLLVIIVGVMGMAIMAYRKGWSGW